MSQEPRSEERSEEGLAEGSAFVAGYREGLVLADRERELLIAKGPCSTGSCRLHYAHSGPCDMRPRESPPPLRSWSLPPEPGPEVTAVIDQYGQRFEREHADSWVGMEFVGDDDVPDLVLPWELLMRNHSPLTDATQDTTP